MVATASAEKFLANNLIQGYVFDPDDTNPADIAWVDMKEFEGISATFVRMIGTGNLDTFTWLGNTDSAGGGTDRIIKAHAVANEPNLEDDNIHLEITADDIAEVGSANGEKLRYVSISAEFATGTDEGCIVYVRYGANHPRSGLSAEVIG